MASCLDPSEIPSFIEKIPCLLECHQRQYPGAKALEKKAKQLIDSKPPKKPDEFVEFLKEVCKWGRILRITSRIFKNNEPKQIKSILCKGYELAKSKNNVAGGVKCISGLYGVSQSSASKMLRFLLPDHAVILDSRIRGKCGYKETVHGYTEFLKSCQDLRKQARRSQKLPANLRNAYASAILKLHCLCTYKNLSRKLCK